MQQNINNFLIKQNDTLPTLKIEIKYRTYLDSLVPYCLSAVTAVTYSMADDCGNLKISSASAHTLCIAGGTIQYSWLPGATDTHGNFIGEFSLFSSGGTITIPTLDGLKISVVKSINGNNF